MSSGLDVFFQSDDDGGEENLTTQKRDDGEFPDSVYKKWYRAKNRSGFLSLDTWLEAGKVSVDIGEVTQATSNTKVWCDAVEFATYLRAVATGNAKELYPARSGLSTPEGFVYYGGGEVEGRKVSRILKVVYWGGQDNYDSSAFNYKAGHFAATVNDQGAYIPNMKEPLSVNMIKVSRAEVAQMSYRLDIAIQRFANIYDGDVFRALNGNVDR